MLTARDHVAVKTAMEERQARECERYQRQTAFAAYRMSGSGKSSCNTPYRGAAGVGTLYSLICGVPVGSIVWNLADGLITLGKSYLYLSGTTLVL